MAEPSDLMGNLALPHRRGGWKSRVCKLAFLLLLVALSGRLTWVVLKTETGGTMLWAQWWDASLGIFAGRTATISQLEPSDQAAFWLSEAKRITATEPQSAELAMGAALVLDSPATDFMFRYLTMPDGLKSGDLSNLVSASSDPEIDWHGLNNALARFEGMCGAPCLEMAARATEIEREEAPWWRLRALLQVAGSAWGERQPRTREWLKAVEQCSAHDPDNAVYDYLVASQFWDDSTSYDFSEGESHFVIKDKQEFEEGLRHFSRGQKKRFCRVGDEWCRAVVEFLDRSKVTPLDRLAIASSRLIPARVSFALFQVVRTQQRRAEQQERDGDPLGALALLRQNLHCLDQFSDSGPSLEYGTSSILRSSTLSMLQTLAEKHPELVSSRELASVKSDAKAAVLRNRVLAESGVRLMRKHAVEPVSTLKFALLGVAASSVTVLLIVGVVCWLVGLYLRKGQERPADLLGPFRHTATWIAGYGLSFAALGIAPAEIIPVVAQTWIALAFIAIATSSIMLWLAWRVTSLLKGIVRAWFVKVLGIALALALLPISGTALWDFSGVPARGWDGANVRVLRYFLIQGGNASGGIWEWALTQWCAAYPGGCVSIVVSIALLILWYMFKWVRSSGQARQIFRSRSLWTGLFACVGRSMLFVGFGWLLIYLWLVPAAMQLADDTYQKKMAYYRNPQQYWNSASAMINEVEADKEWMAGIRADVQSN